MVLFPFPFLNNAMVSPVSCRMSSTWLLRYQDGQMQRWRYESQIILSQKYFRFYFYHLLASSSFHRNMDSAVLKYNIGIKCHYSTVQL